MKMMMMKTGRRRRRRRRRRRERGRDCENGNCKTVRREEENKTCAVSFTQNVGLNLDKCSSFPVVLRSSLLSYYGVCNHKKGGEEVAAVGASASLLRSCCAARAQPPRTTTDARRARPLAAVATPPSRCRRRLNRNPDLRSPRLPGTVPSQLAKFGDIQNMKV
jgi:hypothetical protein